MSSEIEALLALVKDAGGANIKPFVIDAPEGRTFLAIPNGEVGWEERDITSPNKAEVLPPKLITQAVQMQTVDTFDAYMHRFKNDNSVIFADIATNTLLGVIDYHTAANPNVGPEAINRPVEEGVSANRAPEAKHTKHTARLQIPHSLEWQTWLGIDGQLMRHVDFSSHLEENAMDILPLGILKDSGGNIVEEAPTTILELCRELQVRSTYGAASEIRNGDYASIEMQKGDDVTTKKNIALPVSIDLNIPVYFGEQPVLVKAFIRRKVVDGQLKLGIKLQRPEAARQAEFKRIVAEVESDVLLTTLYGKPA